MNNAARSQTAEAFLRAYGGDRFEARSVGLKPQQIEPLTIAVMEELGFDMHRHRSKGLKELPRPLHFDYLVTVCNRAERTCPLLPGIGERLSWPFEDPANFTGSEEERLAEFRRIRDGIELFIRGWLGEHAAQLGRPPRR
jgi:arsenate reductase